MEHRLFYGPPLFQMLDNNPLEQFRSDSGVPDTLGVDNNDRSAGTDAEAGSFAALHACWTEQEVFALEEAGQLRVEAATATLHGAKTARADDHVPPIRLHEGFRLRHR